MAILDLQRREMEAGRIRFGNKVGNRPNRLDHPLLTSPDYDLIKGVGDAHGRIVTNWPGGEGQWQVEIEGDLNVLIPVQPEPVSQWWERWSGGGCMRRCDGITDTINDQPCDCDKTADKRACSATTRFIVLLPETGDARWRVETKSLYAAMELPASLERAVGERTGEVIPAVLSVEQRPGKKGKVPVPVVRIEKDYTGSPGRINAAGDSAADSAAAEQPESVALSGGRVESPEAGGASGDSPALNAQPEFAETMRERGASDDLVRAAQEAALITEPQRKRMMAIAREKNVTTDELKEIVADLAGVTSSKAIPADKYDLVIAGVENMGELKAMEGE